MTEVGVANIVDNGHHGVGGEGDQRKKNKTKPSAKKSGMH
jgi:hypothetical protein